MSRNDLALGPKIQVSVGQVVPYRGGSKGRVLVVDAQSPGGAETTYPIYTKDETTRAVFSHRVDGSLGVTGGSPFDIALAPEEIKVHVRAYRDTNGVLRLIAARDEWPDTPLQAVGETTCILKIAPAE